MVSNDERISLTFGISYFVLIPTNILCFGTRTIGGHIMLIGMITYHFQQKKHNLPQRNCRYKGSSAYSSDEGKTYGEPMILIDNFWSKDMEYDDMGYTKLVLLHHS